MRTVITSYSIHYTKLYDQGEGEGRLPDACRYASCNAWSVSSRVSGFASHFVYERTMPVITSYSIHYTKLYEMMILHDQGMLARTIV